MRGRERSAFSVLSGQRCARSNREDAIEPTSLRSPSACLQQTLLASCGAGASGGAGRAGMMNNEQWAGSS